MNTNTTEDQDTETQLLKRSMIGPALEPEPPRTLESLADLVRTTLPLLHPIHRLGINRQARVVVVSLYAHQLVVTPSLDVFELKGKTLLLTAFSSLIRSILATHERNSRLLDSVLESIRKAEDFLKLGRISVAYGLLESARRTLKPKPSCRRPAPSLGSIPQANPSLH